MITSLCEIEAGELASLKDLTSRVGRNPLLTQASSGNSSIKLGDAMWIKASGKWMADAAGEEIMVPLDLCHVRECMTKNLDPVERFPNASLETSMHAVLPHRVVLHVHSVNTIAWAVQLNAREELESRLEGLSWRWIRYVPSGLPLALEIDSMIAAHPETNILVLGNHGLVIAAKDCQSVEAYLSEVEQRLAITPRQPHPADYALLSRIAEETEWELPDDDNIHCLGTDAVSRRILSGGFIYPCQAIFSNLTTPDIFHAIPCPERIELLTRDYSKPFLMLEGQGVVVNRYMTPAEHAMMSGLAQVIQRLGADVPVSYLSESDIGDGLSQVAYRYRELANANHGNRERDFSRSVFQ